MKYLFFIVFFLSVNHAQTLNSDIQIEGNFKIVDNISEITELILSSKKDILISSNAMRNLEIATALHTLLTSERSKIYILADVDAIDEPSSYIRNLAFVGAKVRIAPDKTPMPFMIIDRTWIINGTIIARTTPDPDKPSILTESTTSGEQYALTFTQAFCNPDIDNECQNPVLDPWKLVFERNDQQSDQQIPLLNNE